MPMNAIGTSQRSQGFTALNSPISIVRAEMNPQPSGAISSQNQIIPTARV